MSRIEEEEDELQMILEGRDIEEYHEYNEYRKEVQQSEQHFKSNTDSESDGDSDHQRSKSLHSRKQTFDHRFKQNTKSNVRSSHKEVENDFRDGHKSTHNANDINDESETKIKVKVRRTLKPRPKLNADRFMSTEGLALLPQMFSDFKFGSKGSELKDLNALLFRLSHWSHRLFPSLTFDDFIEKCEQLGPKKAVKNYVSKIRNDLPLNLEPNQIPFEDDNYQQNHESEDFNDKDFDYIIANSYVNITENTETQELQTNGTNFQNLTQEDKHMSPSIDGSSLQTTHKNSDDDKVMDEDEDELSEEQLLKEINSEDPLFD